MNANQKQRLLFKEDGLPVLPACLISRCLLGEPCRYHGKRTTQWGTPIGRPALVAKLRRSYTLVPICPEVDAGMSTPRPPTRIIDGRCWCAGEDVTATFERGAEIACQVAREHDAHVAYLLKSSPSCDPTTGVTGRALAAQDVKVIAV